MAESIFKSLTEREKRGTLRMSNIGRPCTRELWYTVNDPEGGEDFSPEVYMKFMTGHILEEVVIMLADLAGHRVEGRQDTVTVNGIDGHRDVVLDGMVVDAKSASTYSYNKFAAGLEKDEDGFGYIEQLQGYLEAGQDDPIVTVKDKAAFLVIDKTLGNICLDIHERREDPSVRDIIDMKKEIVARKDPPERGFEAVPEGKSGNMKLPFNCSYCSRMRQCWPEAKTYLYSSGPVHLVEIKKEPKVPLLEVTDG